MKAKSFSLIYWNQYDTSAGGFSSFATLVLLRITWFAEKKTILVFNKCSQNLLR